MIGMKGSRNGGGDIKGMVGTRKEMEEGKTKGMEGTRKGMEGTRKGMEGTRKGMEDGARMGME